MTWIQYAGASLLSRWDTPLILLALLMIVIGVGYGMAMLAASRRDPPGPRDSRNPHPRRSGSRRGAHDLIIAAHAAQTGRTILSRAAMARFGQLPGVSAVDA